MPVVDQNALGGRGEHHVYLRLTSMKNRREPLFRPAFLGEKYPTLDYLVILTGRGAVRPFFFVQVKTTRLAGKKSDKFTVRGRDIDALLEFPAPTYLALVDERRGSVYFKAVHHRKTRRSYKPSRRFVLTEPNLTRLYAEVRAFWKQNAVKPITSQFHDQAIW